MIHAYQREPYRRELDTEILQVGGSSAGRWAVLADTVLYPEAGGQPADLGTLNGIAVIDVQRVDDQIRHFVDGPIAPGKVTVALDWSRRYDHMQQHTAQHLLTAIAADRCGWQTSSFHLGEQVSDIELDVERLEAPDLERLEEAVAVEVRAARAVTTRRVTPEELERLDVRTRGLPAGHRGDVRLVEIAGLDLNTCGGTHLESTAEIEAVKLLGSETMRGGVRLSWVAGARVRQRLADHELRNAQMRSLLETSDNELAALLTLKLGQLRDLGRHNRGLSARLAELEGAELAGRAEPLVHRHFDDNEPAFLQQVARHFIADESEGARLALLTASHTRGGFFVLAARDPAIDVGELGAAVADKLGGRGGGSGQLFQGKTGPSPDHQEALQLLGEQSLDSEPGSLSSQSPGEP